MELCQYPCQNRTRYFTIKAIQIPIIYNRYAEQAVRIGWDVESGMWGIFRVMKHSIRCKCKGLCGRIINCIK